MPSETLRTPLAERWPASTTTGEAAENPSGRFLIATVTGPVYPSIRSTLTVNLWPLPTGIVESRPAMEALNPGWGCRMVSLYL